MCEFILCVGTTSCVCMCMYVCVYVSMNRSPLVYVRMCVYVGMNRSPFLRNTEVETHDQFNTYTDSTAKRGK